MTNRIRVLQFISGISIGNPSGGAEYFAIRLARALDQNRFVSALYVLWKYDTPEEKEWAVRLEHQGIRVLGLNICPSSIGPQDLIKVFSDFQKGVTYFQPQIINSHTERCDWMNASVHLFHPAHPIAIRTVHIDKQWQTHPNFGKLFTHFIAPLAFRREIAISKTVQQMLNKRAISRFLRKEPSLCYNGIDEDLLSSSIAKLKEGGLIPGLHPNQPVIGVVGRLAEQKGHKYLLHAFARIVKVIPAQLVIIGTGPLEDSLLNLTKELEIENQVHFLGSRKDVINILPNFDLLVSASLWEGFPTVLLEAMAVGVPVVATDVSGSRELVTTGETGILVPPADEVSLTKAILDQLRDGQKTMVMAQKAKEKISRFTMQNTVKQYSEIYHQMVK